MNDSNNFRVGILGNGFVGSSLAFGFSTCNEYDFSIKIYDVNPDKSTHSLEDTVKHSDFIFLCLPTPPKEDMSIDLSYIETALEQIRGYIDSEKQLVIIKSTVIPSTCRKLSSKYGLKILSNPEFLTERTAKFDFINAVQIIIGSDKKEDGLKLKSLYEKRFHSKKYLITDTITSEFIKYFLNCFFSVKISFVNEMYQAGKALGVDWHDSIEGFTGDCRVADSHVTVPGKNGELGFGGKCFPKDLNAMIKFSETLGVEPCVMEAAWKKNKEIR